MYTGNTEGGIFVKYRLIGFVGIITGICFLASQFISVQGDRVYIYPPGAQEDAYPVEIQSSDSQLIVDGCSIPHKTVAIEVSEAEAKKLREEAGYSSEGVSGGVIVEFKETGSCSFHHSPQNM
jgi:hypothetical protein